MPQHVVGGFFSVSICFLCHVDDLVGWLDAVAIRAVIANLQQIFRFLKMECVTHRGKFLRKTQGIRGNVNVT